MMINSHNTFKYPLVLSTLSLLVACNNSVANSAESNVSNLNNTEQVLFTLDSYTKEDEALFGSPLAYLIAMDNVTAAKTLLRTGVDVNTSNLLNETPLEQAIQTNSIAMLSLLLQYGANVNYLAEPVSCNRILASANGGNMRFYEMPLDHAYKKGNAEIITLLEQAGAKSIVQCFKAE